MCRGRAGLVGTWILGLFGLLVSLSTGTASEKKPNFILILADDLGYGDLSCYDSKTIKTPNIDKLAARGARLTDFYAAAPICTPTRAALMTGCYAYRVGLPTPLHVYDKIGLNPKETTLPELLGKNDYRTACLGKWHLGHSSKFYPTKHGFDEYWGTPLGHFFDRPAVGKNANDASALFLDNEKPIDFPKHGDLTELLTDKAVTFIGKNKDNPFFMFVSHPMPHEPLAVSKRFRGKSKGGLYGDVVECIDWSVGRIVEAVEEHGLAENTVIVFTSDNGPKKGHGSAGKLRGFKHEPYEGGVRVPCVFWGTGRISPGRTIRAVATLMDIYPTFATLAGLKVSRDQVLDGVDLSRKLAFLEGRGLTRTFYYFVRHGKLVGIREGRWKLLEYRGKTELYDLFADPGETRDVSKKWQLVVRQLQKRMKEFRTEIERERRKPGSSE